jgi:hypothetical protein
MPLSDQTLVHPLGEDAETVIRIADGTVGSCRSRDAQIEVLRMVNSTSRRDDPEGGCRRLRRRPSAFMSFRLS